MAHILIVEDEAHIAQMIGATLALGGYTSETCADGQKAVERIFSGGFDLILLDVMLPGLDGFSVMERVAELDVPVIFLSAMQQVADKVKACTWGPRTTSPSPLRRWSCWPGWRLPCAGGAGARRCCNTATSGRTWRPTPSPGAAGR